MHKLPFAHRIKKPFTYVSSGDTDVAKTIKRAREAMKEKPIQAKNVRPIKVKIKQAA